MKSSISLIVLTFNEEKNLPRYFESVKNLVEEIFVVDSYSTDKTVEIAEKFGAKVFQRVFINQAEQFNWALDNLPITTEWILRLDADEYLTPELCEEIRRVLPETPSETTGFYVKRRVYFLGRWIRHGDYYPTWFLRLWRKGAARIEEREVDEHAVLLRGKAERLKNDFIDENKNGLEAWTAKINNYTSREVRERKNKNEPTSELGNNQAAKKRWLRRNIYYHLPLFCRAFLYFFYRYFIRLGFLDGKEGLIFHFLQGCWNQFLVDAKIYEYESRRKRGNGEKGN